jgi:DNA-binding MarR family transcriptional regulator
MSEPPPWYEIIVMPALLGEARRAYGVAIREAFLENGFDDMPKRGAFIVGSIARNGAAQQDFAIGMGVSKQVASQLVDTLVARGYVERAADPDDRRRMVVTLTARGSAAATASRKAVARVNRALEKKATAHDLATLRRVLGALVEIKNEMSPHEQA